MSLIEDIKQHGETTMNLTKKIYKSLQCNPEEFTKMILTLVEDDNRDMIKFINSYIIGCKRRMLRVCLLEEPWKFHKIYNLCAEIYEELEMRSLISEFTIYELLSSNKIGNKFIFFKYLSENNCNIFTRVQLYEIFLENTQLCIQNDTILKHILSESIIIHHDDIYGKDKVYKVLLEDNGDNQLIINFFRELSTNNSMRKFEPLSQVCKDFIELVEEKFDKWGLSLEVFGIYDY